MTANKQEKNRKVIDVPDFWAPLPPGMLIVILVLLLSTVSTGVNCIILFALESSFYFGFKPEFLVGSFFIGSQLIGIPLLFIVRGFNKKAIFYVRAYLTFLTLIPLPYLFYEPTGNKLWVGYMAIFTALIALAITYTISYQIFARYYEKLKEWKAETHVGKA